MKKSKYRFLKTVNISDNYLYNQTSIEYCIPSDVTIPNDGSFLIVKDGVGNGLGEVAYYEQDSNFIDYISAGIIGISVKDKKKWYILSLLKSQHFKDFINVNTAQGSTIRHSKLVALKYKIPFPTTKNHKKPELIEKYISLLTQNIVDKEKHIVIRQKEIDRLVYNELKNNQKSNFRYSLPRKNDLLSTTRFDTGLYTKKYKKEINLINNYKNGFTSIDITKFKSGSTPKIRIFNASNSVLKWVTPTNISDEGFYNPIEKISMLTKHNLNKDCILFINRTSKGKKGEFVGITSFYDINYYGEGHHNQGIYRVENLPKDDMIFITSFMNSRIMRKICGYISIGSKMKEMKSKDFAKLKFPKFNNSLKQQISKLYYNEIHSKDFNFDTYLINEKKRNKELGIFQLNIEIVKIKKELESIINKIITEKPINI